MTTLTLLEQVASDGIELALTASGKIRARGAQHALDRWRLVLRERKSEIVAALVANDDAGRRWLVGFAGRASLEVIFSQPLAIDDVRKLYPTAAGIEH